MCNVDNSAVSVWLTASVSGPYASGSRFNTGQPSPALPTAHCDITQAHWTELYTAQWASLRCTAQWASKISGNLPEQIRPHQISMFQSSHSGIQKSTEYNKEPLYSVQWQFQSPSIKATLKSSIPQFLESSQGTHTWSRVLLPTPNTLSGIALVWGQDQVKLVMPQVWR